MPWIRNIILCLNVFVLSVNTAQYSKKAGMLCLCSLPPLGGGNDIIDIGRPRYRLRVIMISQTHKFILLATQTIQSPVFKKPKCLFRRVTYICLVTKGSSNLRKTFPSVPTRFLSPRALLVLYLTILDPFWIHLLVFLSCQY